MFNNKNQLFIFKKYFYKKYKFHIFVGLVLALIFSLLTLSTPYITRFLIDVIFFQNQSVLLFKLLLLCALIIGIMSISGYFSNYFLILAIEDAKKEMRKDFFVRLLKFPVVFIGETGSGEINYRIFSDTETIADFVSTILIKIPLDLILSIIILFIMFQWDKTMTLFVFFTLLIQLFLVIFFKNKLFEIALIKKNISQSVSGYAVEKLRHIELVRALNAEKIEEKNINEKLNSLKEINIKSYMLGKMIDIVSLIINNFWSFGVLWFGGRMVINNQITLGTLMGFLIIAGMLYPRFASFVSSLLSFQNARASIIRYLEYYNQFLVLETEDTGMKVEFKEGKVKMKNITFGHYPDKIIFENINIEFTPKAINVITGKSGAGKTTIARLLARIYEPISGTIEIDNIPINEININSFRNSVGFVPQDNFIFKGTVWENLTYGCSEDIDLEKVIDATKKAGAYDFIMKMPLQFQTIVGENGAKLSRGEGQRIALARIFIKKPKVVIFDEPTSFIDIETENIIHQSLLELAKEATIIVVAHRPSTIALADNVINVDDLVSQ